MLKLQCNEQVSYNSLNNSSFLTIFAKVNLLYRFIIILLSANSEGERDKEMKTTIVFFAVPDFIEINRLLEIHSGLCLAQGCEKKEEGKSNLIKLSVPQNVYVFTTTKIHSFKNSIMFFFLSTK